MQKWFLRLKTGMETLVIEGQSAVPASIYLNDALDCLVHGSFSTRIPLPQFIDGELLEIGIDDNAFVSDMYAQPILV